PQSAPSPADTRESSSSAPVSGRKAGTPRARLHPAAKTVRGGGHLSTPPPIDPSAPGHRPGKGRPPPTPAPAPVQFWLRTDRRGCVPLHPYPMLIQNIASPWDACIFTELFFISP
uniref:Uncharacterized protein n=1 Tax=Aegilops tauschii subsp. strangulata TaxID=200361 RepID=A0A453N6P2_AEGTS